MQQINQHKTVPQSQYSNVHESEKIYNIGLGRNTIGALLDLMILFNSGEILKKQ